jgi:hypothetical protein
MSMILSARRFLVVLQRREGVLDRDGEEVMEVMEDDEVENERA